MNVTLPDSFREWIEAQSRLGGYDNIDGYVESVLRDERDRIRHDVDQKLLAGLESGDPIEVNEAFWAERRRVLKERTRQHAKESV
jgi:antitoxin ParD1/3/4